MSGTDLALVISGLVGLLTLIFQNVWKGWTDARDRRWAEENRARDKFELSHKTEQEAMKVAQLAQDRIDQLRLTLDAQTRQAAADAAEAATARALMTAAIARNTERLDLNARQATDERATLATKIDQNASKSIAAYNEASTAIHVANGSNEKLIALTKELRDGRAIAPPDSLMTIDTNTRMRNVETTVGPAAAQVMRQAAAVVIPVVGDTPLAIDTNDRVKTVEDQLVHAASKDPV